VKRLFALFLSAVMLLTLLPAASAFAVTDYTVETEWEATIFEREYHNSTVTTYPSVADGNHLLWIDRMADLPDFARRFYNWLEDNATADGTLANPSRADSYGSRKVYLVDTITGSVPFTYKTGDSLTNLAFAAAQADVGNVPNIIANYAFATYGAFDRDHPEVFWLTGNSKCGSSLSYGFENAYGGVATATYTLKVYFYLTADSFDVRREEYQEVGAVAEAIDRREAAIGQILEDYPQDASVYDQICYFSDSLTLSNAYNSAVADGDYTSAAGTAWECISALEGNNGAAGPVCEGYARALKVLCDRVSIPCVLAEGTARGGDHMWNQVKMDNEWYAVDVTWNDPVSTTKPMAKVSGFESTDWIGLGSETVGADGAVFSESHVLDNVTVNGGLAYNNGPVLSRTAYQIAENYLNMALYRCGQSYTAPEKEGYVFAGWFMDEALTQPVSANVTEGWAYAKFVLEDTLTLKFQTTLGTSAASEKTDLRLLTSVEGLNLSSVYFDVTIGTVSRRIASNTAYEQVKSGGTLITSPALVFGPDSRYFVTYTLLETPASMFDIEITATPGWETLDGTCVSGTQRTFRISDTY